MSPDENKAVAQRFYAEIMTGGNQDAIPQLLTEDYREHMAGNPESMDRDGFTRFLGMFRAAFPDLSDAPEEMIAEGSKVAVRGVMRGTHQGELMGIPATGKSVTVPWMAILEMHDGRIRRTWLTVDTLGMMQQLGVAPTPAGAPA